MHKVIEIFKQITKIPHCSGKTEKIQEFIIDYANKRDFNVKRDKAGNILCFKDKPKIALQSHIDMVCVGDVDNIELVEDGDFLKAKNSTLGADNGIGVAMMLYFMNKYDNVEYLFTNDEEIGLIGAEKLELKLKAPYLLNLDSEDDKEIIIGSAGGVDIIAEYPLKREKVYGSLGDVSVTNLPGGHSGVDINKNIPNAIIELLKRVENLAYIKGGEKSNAIPANAYAKEVFSGNDEVEVYNKEYLKFLRSLPNGVLEFDFEYKIPSKSINFGMIEGNRVVLSARANDNEKLEELKEYIFSKLPNCKISLDEEYPAWKPEKNELALKLQKITGVELKAIHAGLECGLLKEKFPHIQMASYGPLIENPHSIRERVSISSVERVTKAVEELIKNL